MSQEGILLLGSGCALLMQLAHPLVAAGVDEHSDFRKRPLARMRRTLELTLGLVFGTREDAIAAARRITQAHRLVRGWLPEDAGWLPRGTPYRADDPELMRWVLATLVYSTVATYDAFVGPVSAADRESFYQETKAVGGLFGIPAASFASDWLGFEDYLSGMMETGPVVVSACARELAGYVLRPRFGLVPPSVYVPFEVLTAGLLPPALRQAYALPWGPGRRRAFGLATRLLPGLVSRAPAILRIIPAARSAQRRLQAAAG